MRLHAALLSLAVLAVGCGRGERESRGPSSGPHRIVSLTPSATEVVAALDATELIVGVDEYTTYPPAVAKVPRVGTFLAPNVEAILRLRPTLVVVDDVHTDVAASLKELGIATVACPMHGLADVRRSLEIVGERIGRAAQARSAVAAIDLAVHEVTSRRQGGPRPRVLAVIDREPTGLGYLVAGGPGSWHDELLRLVGAENVLATAPARYPKLSLEELLRASPDVIIDTTFGADPARVADDWAPAARVPAVAHRRVAVMKEPYFMAPSPRVARALEELDAFIHGDVPQASPPAPPP